MQANQDVAELTEATELLQLAAAELQAAQSLTADRITAISSRMSSIAALAAELLPRLSTRRLHELLEQHGISCSSSSSNATSAQPPEWCDSDSPGELLLHLVPLLRLPVCLLGPKGKVLSSSLGCGGSIQQQGVQQQQQQQHKLRKGQVPNVEPVSDPFNNFGMALVQKPCEVVAHYLQRMFFRLLSVVPVEYMRDLHVPCQRTDSRSRCISFLPTWVTAQAVTIDKRTGRAHVTGPSSCAVGSSRSAADAAACAAAAARSSSSSSCQASSSCSTCSCSRQSSSCSSNTETDQQGAVDVCGFLHVKALAPGMQLPLAGEKHMSTQQREAGQRAADAAPVHQGTPGGSSCSVSSSGSNGGCKASSGVYYYYFPDIPALLDHVIVTQVGGFCSVVMRLGAPRVKFATQQAGVGFGGRGCGSNTQNMGGGSRCLGLGGRRKPNRLKQAGVQRYMGCCGCGQCTVFGRKQAKVDFFGGLRYNFACILCVFVCPQETEDSIYLLTLLDELTQPYNLRAAVQLCMYTVWLHNVFAGN